VTSVNLNPLPNAVGPERTDVPIYFLHIPKTAGSTLSGFLESLFLSSELWHRGGDRWTWASIIKLNPAQIRCSQIINGHFAGYFFSYMPTPLRYFTVVRDPLARAISHYEHVLRDKAHYFHALAQELKTFGAYLRDERTQPTVVNFELRSLGATLDPVGFAKTLTPKQIQQNELEKHLDTVPLTQSAGELLKTATARLDKMCFVGLTERFDESLSLLCEIFGWPRAAALEARNVNPRRMSVKDLPTKDVRLLTRLNEADIELYQSAKERFERDWARSRFVYPHLHAFVSYAQNAEDVLLHRALRDVSSGTYIDVGANHPSGDSVTKAFYDRGWRGINIEPIAAMYEALVKQRPADLNIQAAAGATTATRKLYEIPGTGLSTLDASIADRHRNQGFKVNEARVKVRTLRSILAKAPRADIHFLKVDVEGWEKEVLQGIDLATTRPWIILIEATEPNTETPSYEVWEPLLLNNGYLFVFFDGLNRYYLAREKRTLRKAFTHPVCSGDVYIKASEAAAAGALREAQWSLRRQTVLLREQQTTLAEVNERAQSIQVYSETLLRERDGLRQEVAAHVSARGVEREEAILQINALTQWATSADAYGKSLVVECEGLRRALDVANEARETERIDAVRQIEALSRWATSADAYGKSQVVECEGLRAALSAANEAREAERVEAIRQGEALIERVESADAFAKSQTSECEVLRVALMNANGARESEQLEASRQIKELADRGASAKANAKSLASECEALRVALMDANGARESEQLEVSRRLKELADRGDSAEANAKALASECDVLRATVMDVNGTRESEQLEASRQLKELAVRCASAEANTKSLANECEVLRVTLTDFKAAQGAERLGAMRQIEVLTERAALADATRNAIAVELRQSREAFRREVSMRKADQESSRQRINEWTLSAGRATEYAGSLLKEGDGLRATLKEERAARVLDQTEMFNRTHQLQVRLASLERERENGVVLEAELSSALRREQSERKVAIAEWSCERNKFEADTLALVEQLQRVDERADALAAELNALREKQARSIAKWEIEREDLDNSLIALEGCLSELRRHWAVRLLVSRRYMSRIWGS
jgi:FkbM family methyltransferase